MTSSRRSRCLRSPSPRRRASGCTARAGPGSPGPLSDASAVTGRGRIHSDREVGVPRHVQQRAARRRRPPSSGCIQRSTGRTSRALLGVHLAAAWAWRSGRGTAEVTRIPLALLLCPQAVRRSRTQAELRRRSSAAQPGFASMPAEEFGEDHVYPGVVRSAGSSALREHHRAEQVDVELVPARRLTDRLRIRFQPRRSRRCAAVSRGPAGASRWRACSRMPAGCARSPTRSDAPGNASAQLLRHAPWCAPANTSSSPRAYSAAAIGRTDAQNRHP